MEKKIQLGHGSGGKLMNDMITDIIKPAFGKNLQLDDSAVLEIGDTRIAFTTDTFTISPIFFPGGDIGKLAVNGTVNDLAVIGATPAYLSCGLILEEGFETDSLCLILESLKSAADYAGIEIVTGDTKIVQQKKGDKIYINTAGIGIIENDIIRRQAIPGDKIIINGTIGDHGISVMAARNDLTFARGLESDCAPLNHLIKEINSTFPEKIKFIRDATRGGAASVLNELVKNQPFAAKLDPLEELPVKQEVRGVCDILGLDPLYAANEGKLIMIADKDSAEDIVAQMRKIKEGAEACIIGEITSEYPGSVYIETSVGGKRLLPLLVDEQLPRIC